MSFTSHKDEILKELEAKTAQALEICGGMAESYAKEACPVDTGRLRNSITHAQVGKDTEVIGTNVEYGPYVELGTHKQAAQPFLRPAAEGHSSEYKAIMQQIISS
jgi:HK97 gp10 family phage protein